MYADRWNVKQRDKNESIRRAVGDFGCGTNTFRTLVDNVVYAFDHVAKDDTVIPCDISNVPLDAEVLEAAAFSLALQGRNFVDYLKEAFRTLKPGGKIFLCEPVYKWSVRNDTLVERLAEVGFKDCQITRKKKKFFYVEAVKPNPNEPRKFSALTCNHPRLRYE